VVKLLRTKLRMLAETGAVLGRVSPGAAAGEARQRRPAQFPGLSWEAAGSFGLVWFGRAAQL
jgi:hypothetical protein